MDEIRIKFNGGFHNDVFYIKGKNKVVRISDYKKTKEMVLQEIDWMSFLYGKGVAVPKPEMTLVSEEDRVRTYFEFIKGEQVDVTNVTQWNVKTFEHLGRILGRMHSLSKEFETEVINRPKWTVGNPDVFGIRKNLSQQKRESYDKLMQSLLSYDITPDTFGLIHNDFHQGNIIIGEEERITTIDFDECSFNWFAQDIAVVFYHAYWQHSSFNNNIDTFSQTFMSHFFTGYRTENQLHRDTMKQIPTFLKLREIFLYQLFIQKWDMDKLEEWQKYNLEN
ncbi:phosphotransferase enzyme family protein [Paenisporosarcina sp. TG20]|uniref:phosphotransferase enzyme family protein n=1 Tax=Paenisporosarcina sp. TG20 TaxID=1211706 RepID=UPI00031F06A2|nr:phosphotransferase [Paenisporosarcina sp. TG20]